MKNPALLKNFNDIFFKKLKNKRVLLRVDFNIPIDENGMTDNNEDWRIKAVLPTIKFLLKHNAKIILLAHLGRPGGKIQENLRLEPIQGKLSKLLNKPIKKTPDCVGKQVKKTISEMEPGEILILENLRFHKEEEENNEKFAKELASFGDIYINDAFSDSHRNHASIVGITEYLPSYAGLLMEKELKMMQKAINPKHPAIAIIGGAKIETKLPAVMALAKIYDYVLVGGMIANEMMKNRERYITSSNIIFPDKESILQMKGFDIGLSSVRQFAKFIKNAKTIVWNGPMGMFEDVKYQEGTKDIMDLIKLAHKNGANVLIGGGETITAFQKFAPELMNKKVKGFSVSTGGGAMLEFLAGKELLGIEALR